MSRQAMADAAASLTFRDVRCPVCDSDTRRKLFRDRNRRENLDIGGTYWRCVSCGMIYLSPLPDWQQFSEYYQSIFEQQCDPRECAPPPGERPGLWGQVARWSRRFRSRPHSWPNEPGGGRTLLDVGCGIGTKLVEFARRGWRVYGIDINPGALCVARRQVPTGDFRQGELGQVGFEPGSFDVIRLDNVLEHVYQPKMLLQEIQNLLRPGSGRLYVYVPHGESLSMRLLGKYSISAWVPFHVSLFTQTALHRILSEAGFTRVDMFQHYPAERLPASLKQLGWPVLPERVPRWIDFMLLCLCMPIGKMAEWIGIGEELVAVAQ